MVIGINRVRGNIEVFIFFEVAFERMCVYAFSKRE